jgi:cyanophycinase
MDRLAFQLIGRREFLREIAGLGTSALARARGARPEALPRSTGPGRGALLIIGGGQRGQEIRDAALKLGGGADARWVYIPTAASDAEIPKETPPTFVGRSGASFTVLHTRDRVVADSEAFTAPLRLATAVFIDGRRQ